MSIALLLLKLLGLIASAGFGIIGTMHEFRDAQTKRLTQWGKLAVIGTVISALVAISAQLLESHLSAATSQEAVLQSLNASRRLEKIVTQLNRTLQPIDSVSATFDFGVPFDDPAFRRYKGRLDAGIAALLRLPQAKRIENKGITVSLSTASDRPLKVSASMERYALQPWFGGGEEIAEMALMPTSIELSFYKSPINPMDFTPLSHGVMTEPDLLITLTEYSKGFLKDLELVKSLQDGEYDLTATLESTRKEWEDNTGRIIAIPDLAGAQLYISVGPVAVEFSDPRETKLLNEKFLAVRQKFKLNSLELRFNNRTLHISSSRLRKYVSRRGFTYWLFVFPEKEELFRE